MSSSRREFLKGAAETSLAGIATAAGIASGAGTAGAAAGATAGAVGAAPARRRRHSSASHDMPRGMTLLSIRSEHGDTLGVKTDRGILDIRRASLALHVAVPLTLDDLLQQGGAPELAHLAAAAQKARHADSLYVDEAGITHGRLFANPGKIVCIGLNYREHAKEAGEKVPAIPSSSTSTTTHSPAMARPF